MNIKRIKHNDIDVAIVESNEVILTDIQSALDFIATVYYKTECNRVAISKSAIIEDFFSLSTGIAGEILQKFIIYQFKLAIIGDFKHYAGKSLRDFIYESNKGSHIFFVETEEEAVLKLSK